LGLVWLISITRQVRKGSFGWSVGRLLYLRGEPEKLRRKQGLPKGSGTSPQGGVHNILLTIGLFGRPVQGGVHYKSSTSKIEESHRKKSVRLRRKKGREVKRDTNVLFHQSLGVSSLGGVWGQPLRWRRGADLAVTEPGKNSASRVE